MISQTSQNAGLNDEALNLAPAANQSAPDGPAANGADGPLTQPGRAAATPVAKPAPAVAQVPVTKVPVTKVPVPTVPVPTTAVGNTPVPKTQRVADAQKPEAHAERRQRLAERIRVENPARSEEEIEERLEQFGA